MSVSCPHQDERLEVAATALSLRESGLVVNTSGNVSVRINDQVIITPSGRAYDSLAAEDICVLDLDGNWVDGEHLPSSETPLHLAVYNADPSIQAIVHTHSVHATAASTLVDTLPAIHYQMADLGGEIPVAPYATFGSAALANSVLSVLPGHNAVLMKNHGSITCASNLQKALARTITLEWCAEVWLKATAAGQPSTLDSDELKRVKQQMESIAEQRAKPRGERENKCCGAQNNDSI